MYNKHCSDCDLLNCYIFMVPKHIDTKTCTYSHWFSFCFQLAEGAQKEETPAQKYQRLQHEIRELSEQVNTIKVSKLTSHKNYVKPST